MIVLITGVGGFIGSHLAEECLATGWKVVGIDNFASGRPSNIPNGVALIDSSLYILRDSCMKKYKFDYIFHIAGLADIIPSIERPTDYFKSNVEGTFLVCEYARKQKNLKKLLYAASASCYGMNGCNNGLRNEEPAYPYALTKYLGEQLVEHWGKVYKIPYLSLRLFNVYGDRQRTKGAYGAVFGTFLKQKLEGKPFTVVGDGKQRRDFIHVKDVARAFIDGALSSDSNTYYDIGTGKGQTINHIVELMGGDIVHIPKRPGEPDVTEARRIPKWFRPKENFDDQVLNMVKNIHLYKDAPLWDAKSIAKETKEWFKWLK